MNFANVKAIPIVSSMLAGIAFAVFFFRMSIGPMILVILILALIGALLSISLQYLLRKIYQEDLSIVRMIDISVLPFGVFFLLVIVSSGIVQLILPMQYLPIQFLIWGLVMSFISSLLVLLTMCIKKRKGTTKIVGVFAITTLIALSAPISLHITISNSLPCANGKCDIDVHRH